MSVIHKCTSIISGVPASFQLITAENGATSGIRWSLFSLLGDRNILLCSESLFLSDTSRAH